MILSESVARFTEAVERGYEFSHQDSLLNVIFKYKISEEFKSDLAININSPGFLLFSSKSIVPLVLLAVMALASAASGEPSAPEVRVINSAATPSVDTCTPKVDESVRNILKLMSIDIWREACEKTVRLRQEPKLNGPGHVTPAVTARP